MRRKAREVHTLPRGPPQFKRKKTPRVQPGISLTTFPRLGYIALPGLVPVGTLTAGALLRLGVRISR